MENLTYKTLTERKNYLNIKKSYYDNKLIKLQNKLQNVNKEIDNYKKVNNIMPEKFKKFTDKLFYIWEKNLINYNPTEYKKIIKELQIEIKVLKSDNYYKNYIECEDLRMLINNHICDIYNGKFRKKNI